MRLPKGLRCFASGNADLGVVHQVLAQSFFAIVAIVYQFQKCPVTIKIRKESKLLHQRSEHAAGLQVVVGQAKLALLEADDLVPEPDNLPGQEVSPHNDSLIVVHTPGKLLYISHGTIELPLQFEINSLQLLDLISIRILTLNRISATVVDIRPARLTERNSEGLLTVGRRFEFG